ncbi:hypothetical protein FAVG1_00136 [Fusarium avenaceum]|nr:hypothetical protein FAVG1_00136 [Fusarium avenaceum]
MAPIPGLDPRQEAPVPPPANPYARPPGPPGPAQNPAQLPTPYSGGRVDVQKKGANLWRNFLNWFNDPGLGQDRTAVVIAVGIISLFVIGILAYLFIIKKKKLVDARGSLAGTQAELQASQESHNAIKLDKAMHQEPPTKEEDAEKAKIQEVCDEKCNDLQTRLDRSEQEVENLRK